MNPRIDRDGMITGHNEQIVMSINKPSKAKTEESEVFNVFIKENLITTNVSLHRGNAVMYN